MTERGRQMGNAQKDETAVAVGGVAPKRGRGRPRKYAFPGEVDSPLPPAPAPKPRPGGGGRTIPHNERAARGLHAIQFSLRTPTKEQIERLSIDLACTKSDVVARAVDELDRRVAKKRTST